MRSPLNKAKLHNDYSVQRLLTSPLTKEGLVKGSLHSFQQKKFFEKINELEAKVFLEAQEKGMSIFYLSQDDIEYWKEKSAPIYKKYIERSGSLGEKVFENAKQF